jgi:hypothetical protein
MRSRKWKKCRQYNGRKTKVKRTNNDLHSTTQKIEDWASNMLHVAYKYVSIFELILVAVWCVISVSITMDHKQWFGLHHFKGFGTVHPFGKWYWQVVHITIIIRQCLYGYHLIYLYLAFIQKFPTINSCMLHWKSIFYHTRKFHLTSGMSAKLKIL